MAMADYPYPASFLEPMPAWPVNLACNKIVCKRKEERENRERDERERATGEGKKGRMR